MPTRALLLSLVIALCLAWPARAEADERVLLDAVLYVDPSLGSGLCHVFDPGRIAVTVRRVAEADEQRPARFSLRGFMADPDANVEIPIGRRDVTTTTTVSGADRYCWGVDIDAPETAGMARAQRGAYVQTIAVRITHRPD